MIYSTDKELFSSPQISTNTDNPEVDKTQHRSGKLHWRSKPGTWQDEHLALEPMSEPQHSHNYWRSIVKIKYAVTGLVRQMWTPPRCVCASRPEDPQDEHGLLMSLLARVLGRNAASTRFRHRTEPRAPSHSLSCYQTGKAGRTYAGPSRQPPHHPVRAAPHFPEDGTNPKKDGPEERKERETFRTLFCKREPDLTELKPDLTLDLSVMRLQGDPLLPKQQELSTARTRESPGPRGSAAASALPASLGFPAGTLERRNSRISEAACESQHSRRDFREDT